MSRDTALASPETRGNNLICAPTPAFFRKTEAGDNWAVPVHFGIAICHYNEVAGGHHVAGVAGW
jgi:hypothetical protein